MTPRCVGITFTPENAQRNLLGLKDVTRRVAPRQPPPGGSLVSSASAPGLWFVLDAAHHQVGQPFRCRYGSPGDLLWQREAWKPVPATAYAASPGVAQTPNPADPSEVAVYRAGWDRSDGGIPWRPSIHMPHWAARAHRRILGLTAEPLNLITEADARREGFRPPEGGDRQGYAALAFQETWDRIHAASPARQWAANPWVFRVEYAKEDSPCPTLPP